MSTFNTSIIRDDADLGLEVEWTFHAGCRGSRDSLNGIPGAGPPLEPDEEPEIEIEGVTEAGARAEVALTPKEEDLIKQRIWDEIENA